LESNDEERSGRLRLEESLRRDGGLERYVGEQQKVSLLYILQLKFSRRLPSCNVSAHFENTAIERVVSRLTDRMKGCYSEDNFAVVERIRDSQRKEGATGCTA
jgi:hypothetical protein